MTTMMSSGERDSGGIESLAGPSHHIVLSPHYDDMPLSLGATMATFADAGRKVTDLIVFGAEPTGVDLHAFASHHHERWGLSAAEVINARRAEEARAIQILGAGTANLPFFDAIYRSDFYTSDEKLFGSPAAEESDLPTVIAAAAIESACSITELSIDALPETVRFYAPLGIGNHVDHQLAFLAACELDASGYVVWLYEDLPYSMIGDNRARRLSTIAAAGNPVHRVAEIPTDSNWTRKIEAVLAYPSQLETVFLNYAGIEPTPEGISTALDDYHRSAGNGSSAERFWGFGPS